MLTIDLDQALASVVAGLWGSGHDGGLPAAARPEIHGRWRPAPAGGAGGPGRYATSVAFDLADMYGLDRGRAATAIAGSLGSLDWVTAARVTGSGFVTVTAAPPALARLAVRITLAGPACAHSTALAGVTLTTPARAALALVPSWHDASAQLREVLTGRLAEAAGAQVTWTDDCPARLPGSGPQSATASRQGNAGGASPHAAVASAAEFAGLDAVTLALARLPPATPVRVRADEAARHDPGNPAFATRYAHAHAASVLRQAATLGLAPGGAASFRPQLLMHGAEQALLYELSWLPEQVSNAARRGRPDVFARYLERLAGVYLTCQERSPAVWPGMLDAVQGESHAATAPACLWLAAAARTAFATGLGLLGVTAPERL